MGPETLAIGYLDPLGLALFSERQRRRRDTVARRRAGCRVVDTNPVVLQFAKPSQGFHVLIGQSLEGCLRRDLGSPRICLRVSAWGRPSLRFPPMVVPSIHRPSPLIIYATLFLRAALATAVKSSGRALIWEAACVT